MRTRSFTRTSVLALVLALFPCTARAQNMAASFGELRGLLSIGDVIYVTDTAGVTTWGRVTQISETSLTVRVMRRTQDATVTTNREVTFTEETLGTVRLSDVAGAEGAVIYPVSWDAVNGLDSQAEVTVVLDSGERRKFRFGHLARDHVELFTAAGTQEVLAKTRIRRILLRGVDDTPFDGMVVGSAAGAAGMLVLTLAMYANCVGICEAPAMSEALAVMLPFGAGLGAGIGWVVDKLHRGTRQVFPAPVNARSRRVAVAPVVSPAHRGVRVSIAF